MWNLIITQPTHIHNHYRPQWSHCYACACLLPISIGSKEDTKKNRVAYVVHIASSRSSLETIIIYEPSITAHTTAKLCYAMHNYLTALQLTHYEQRSFVVCARSLAFVMHRRVGVWPARLLQPAAGIWSSQSTSVWMLILDLDLVQFSQFLSGENSNMLSVCLSNTLT